jgi:hypothetical protein
MDKTNQIYAKLLRIRGQEFPGSTNYQWTIRGTPTAEEKALLDKHCYWREEFTAWLYYQETLPAEIQTIVQTQESQMETAKGYNSLQHDDSDIPTPSVTLTASPSETPDLPSAAPDAAPAETMPDKATAIRIIKPQDSTTSEAIQQAVRQAKSLPDVISPAIADRKTLTRIGQEYVGELTGDISGNVHCYGYAIHNGIAVYLNLGGPHTAVEAIRAKLGKGQSVNLVPWDGPAIELTAGEGQTGKYKDFMQKIPEAKFTSLILAHELLVAPNYGGKSTTFIVRTSEAQIVAKLKHHVTELVNIPVFEEWASYLWHAGQKANLVQRTLSAGEIDLWTVSLDIDDWTRLITCGLEQAVIRLPNA